MPFSREMYVFLGSELREICVFSGNTILDKIFWLNKCFFLLPSFNLFLCALNIRFLVKWQNFLVGRKPWNLTCCYCSPLLGILVKSWAQIFATSKAQRLLFRIIDCLLLPHLVLQQDKELPAPMLTAIQKSLPLFLQV